MVELACKKFDKYFLYKNGMVIRAKVVLTFKFVGVKLCTSGSRSNEVICTLVTFLDFLVSPSLSCWPKLP